MKTMHVLKSRAMQQGNECMERLLLKGKLAGDFDSSAAGHFSNCCIPFRILLNFSCFPAFFGSLNCPRLNPFWKCTQEIRKVQGKRRDYTLQAHNRVSIREYILVATVGVTLTPIYLSGLIKRPRRY